VPSVLRIFHFSFYVSSDLSFVTHNHFVLFFGFVRTLRRVLFRHLHLSAFLSTGPGSIFSFRSPVELLMCLPVHVFLSPLLILPHKTFKAPQPVKHKSFSLILLSPVFSLAFLKDSLPIFPFCPSFFLEVSSPLFSPSFFFCPTVGSFSLDLSLLRRVLLPTCDALYLVLSPLDFFL